MYSPIQDGIEKSAQSVRYTEMKASGELCGLVHSFWELKTIAAREEDFHLQAIPDACVNILFNQMDTNIAGITALRTTYETLNLGKTFHYVGIQFYPGVWQGNQDEIVDHFVGTTYLGQLPLIQTNQALAKVDFQSMQPIMSDLVRWLMNEKLVTANVVTEKIMANLDAIRNVTDMAKITCMSTRQLQRVLKQSTGFSPHDFIKVLRLQQSFKRHYLDLYTDQSHFIHAFRKITGYTPTQYSEKFSV